MSGAFSALNEYTGTGFTPGTPEYDDAVRLQNRQGVVAATGLAPGVLSAILPSPTATGVQGYIPGAVSGGYAGLDAAGSLFQQFVMGRKADDVAHLAGGVRAGELNQESKERALSIVPHITPQDAGEQRALNLGTDIGSVAIGVPSGVAGALPGPLRAAAYALAPGRAAAIPTIGIAAPLTGNQIQEEEKAAVGDLNVSETVKPDTGPQSPDTMVVEPQATHAHKTVEVQPDGSTLTIVNPGLLASEDETGLTWGKAILYGTGALVAAAYAPRGFRMGVRAVEELRTGKVRPPGSDALGETRANMVDQDAIVKDVLKETAIDHSVGVRMAAEYGDTIGSDSVMNRYLANSATGEFYGVKIPPIDGLLGKIGKVAQNDPATKQLFDETLYYKNELDNRRINQRTWVKSTPATDEDLAVNFAGQRGNQFMTTADLQARVRVGEANPVVKELLADHKAITDRLPDIAVAKGFSTVQDAAKMRADHPSYVPTSDLDGIIADPFRSRNLTKGSGSHDMPAIQDVLDQHHFAFYKAIEKNDGIRMVIEHLEDYQRRNPNVDKIVMPSKHADGTWNIPEDRQTVVLMRRNGVLEAHHLPDQALRDALNGPPIQHNVILSGANKLRGAIQSGWTGGIAALAGVPYVATLAMRDTALISASRMKGTWASPTEKLLRGAPRPVRALAALDPISPHLGTLYRIGADSGAEVLHGLSKLFSPDNPGKFSQKLDILFGRQAREAISDRFHEVYRETARGKMREGGAIGGYSGSKVVNDVGSSARAEIHMPHLNSMPETFQVNSMRGKVQYVHMKALFDEMRSIVGEAPRSQYYQLNRDNPVLSPRQLIAETRGITGDPSIHGKGAITKVASASVPFYNVSVQGLARVARAYNEAPFAFTVRAFAHIAPLVFGSLYTAMIAGPAAIRHLFDETTNEQRSKEFQFYNPAGDPTKPLKLPIPAELRIMVAPMLQAGYDLLQLVQHEHNPDIAQAVMDVMSGFFSKHVWQSTKDSMVSGISDAMPPVNTMANIPVSAVTGKSVDVTVNNAYKNWGKTDMFARDINGNQRLPGQDTNTDSVTGSTWGAVIESLMHDVLGVGGAALHDFYRDATHPKGGADVAMHNFIDAWQMRAANTIPGTNQLWNVEDRQARATPMFNRVQKSLEVMRQTATYKADEKYIGMTRKGGQELMEQDTLKAKVPQDPVMKQMYELTGAFMNVFNTNPRSPIKELNDLRAQVTSLRNSPLPPSQVLKMRNGLERQIQMKLDNVQDVIHQLNTQLTRAAGRPIRVDHIDWNKGPEQFN